jgi:hypothetical protein
MQTACAECNCVPQECEGKNIKDCNLCIKIKENCCCSSIHNQCTSINYRFYIHSIGEFFKHIKYLYAAALGIEILCITAAEIGENTALYLFGFNWIGIPIAYLMGYALAGFVTFVTIFGRYNYNQSKRILITDSCCSVLGQCADKGFLTNLRITFLNFGVGMKKIFLIHNQPNLKYILKTSIFILVTAESACILTTETIDLVFYNYSLFLSVPLALMAGAFTVVAPEAFRRSKLRTLFNDRNRINGK